LHALTSLDELRRIFKWYCVYAPMFDPIVTFAKFCEFVRDCALLGDTLQYGVLAIELKRCKPQSTCLLLAAEFILASLYRHSGCGYWYRI